MLGDLIGDNIVGGEGIDPRVRNLSLSANGAGMILAEWTTDAENGISSHYIIPYLDGVSSDMAALDDGVISIGPVGDGGHDVQLSVLREEWTGQPRFVADRIGRRVLLRWTRSAETDVAGYNIYHDDQTGTVDYNTVIATVTAIETENLNLALPDEGGGTGRVSVFGTYRGYGEAGEYETINVDWEIEITDYGLFTYDNGTGASEELEYSQGLTRTLDDGIQIHFDSDPDDYEIASVFRFHVGPATWYVTGELDAGTYKFGVKAFDQAGNESASGAEATVLVIEEPDAPSGVSGSYDPDTGEVVLTWTDAADTASVRIYSNWSVTRSVRDEYVIEENPLATVSSGVETYTLSTGTTGEIGVLLFYLRTVDSNGIEEENANLLTVQALAQPRATLSSPFNLTAEPIAAGAARLTWQHDLADGTPDSFDIYTFASEPDAEDVAGATPVNEAVSGTISGDLLTQTYDTSTLAGVRWFVVRAVDESGNDDGNVVSVSVTPDSTAPATVTGFRGAAT